MGRVNQNHFPQISQLKQANRLVKPSDLLLEDNLATESANEQNLTEKNVSRYSWILTTLRAVAIGGTLGLYVVGRRCGKCSETHVHQCQSRPKWWKRRQPGRIVEALKEITNTRNLTLNALMNQYICNALFHHLLIFAYHLNIMQIVLKKELWLE